MPNSVNPLGRLKPLPSTCPQSAALATANAGSFGDVADDVIERDQQLIINYLLMYPGSGAELGTDEFAGELLEGLIGASL